MIPKPDKEPLWSVIDTRWLNNAKQQCVFAVLDVAKDGTRGRVRGSHSRNRTQLLRNVLHLFR